jgi:hypothetical protein
VGEEEVTDDDAHNINSIHKQLLLNINSKLIRGYTFIQETITRTAMRYTSFLTQ